MTNLGTHLADMLLRARVYGLQTPPGEPPMAQAQLSIVGDDADLAIPVLQGDPGPAGTPAAPFKWQTQVASAGELPTLTNSAEDKGKAYVISDGAGTADIAYWNGLTWQYFVDAFGPGLPGPAPDITASGEMVAEASPFEVVVSGAAAAPNLHFRIPETPGPAGPSGGWDLFDAAAVRPDGSIPVWDATAGKMKPVAAATAVPRITRYTLPESAWVTYSGTASAQTVATMTLPALPWPYHVEVSGHARISQASGATTQVALVVRVGDQLSGQIVGKGLAVASGACVIGAHYSSQESGKQSLASAPGSTTGRVAASTSTALYVSAVRESGSGSWSIGQADAQLSVLLIPDPA
ncbi:hypothetical protein [Gordonia sp. (in: high G+C Gram-positive bacteria)]|uniref:hypothetical protein n=1 Tax=Gordonia sp. (in: high G+C Gram-positive bacteria) TaxID=84139 RepID=UPI003C714B86